MHNLVVAVARLNLTVDDEVPFELGLAPILRWIAVDHDAIHRLTLRIDGQLVLSVLGPINEDFVVSQRPMRVGWILRALEMVVAVAFELYIETASIILKIPLGASAVAAKERLHCAERTKEFTGPPILWVALVLGQCIASHRNATFTRLYQHCVFAEIPPVDVDSSIVETPFGRSL